MQTYISITPFLISTFIRRFEVLPSIVSRSLLIKPGLHAGDLHIAARNGL